MRVRTAVTAAVVSGSVVTALAVALPGVRFAYRVPTLHVALETAEGLIALLLAYLSYGRYRLAHRASDYVLSQALALFAATNLVVSAVPRAAFGGHGQELSTWGAVVLRLIGAAAFAAAAWAPEGRVARRYGVASLVGTTVAVLIATVTTVILVGDHLPPGLDPASTNAAVPDLSGEPVVVIVQFLSAALFAVAAGGFTRRALRSDDELALWLSAAAVVSAFARFNYGLFPSLYSGWVYTGDFLRLGFYILLLAGAAREIKRYWDTVSVTATLEERRRVARDLHDGLAQELAFLATQSTRLARGANVDPEVLANTAERALDESRRAIAALTRSVDEPLEATLAQAAEEVGQRAGVTVRCDLEPVGPVSPDAREQLVRVVREAVTNAARHGRAQVVTLTVRGTPQLSVSVTDDGAGFDVSSRPGAPGFGLVSMRERVESLGGRLRVRSGIGEGTAVEIEMDPE